MSVHFPIVLILFSSILYLIVLFKKNETTEHIVRWTIWIATITVWISIFTGNQADGVVGQHLCDPSVMKRHENMAYLLGYCMLISSFFQIITLKYKQQFLKILILILLFSASIFTIITAHWGAALVYQQSAGTYQPSDDCAEFR